MPYLPLLLNWFIFGLIHSLTAGSSCKNYFEKRMGASFKYYRLGFNCIAIINLVIVLYFHFKAPNIEWVLSTPLLQYIAYFLIAFGLGFLFFVFKSYDLYEFTGLDVFVKQAEPQKLLQSGLSKKVRHPMYLALLVLLIGIVLYEPSYRSLISFSAIFIYLQIGIYFEEQKLERTFGQSYIDYKSRTPKLFPKFL